MKQLCPRIVDVVHAPKRIGQWLVVWRRVHGRSVQRPARHVCKNACSMVLSLM